MAKSKKNEIKETEETQNGFDDLWFLMLLPLLFKESSKPAKVINIYMGDDK